MNSEDQAQQVRSWIEKGKRVGASLTVDRGDRRVLVNVTLRKDWRYEVLVEEREVTQMWAEADPERRDERTFATLEEAVAFIERTTPVSSALLARATVDAHGERVSTSPRALSGTRKTTFASKEEQVRASIESGKQVGKSFTVDRGGRQLRGNAAIQKQQDRYRVMVDEFDDALEFDDACVRDDRRTFTTLDEAIAFVERNAPVKVAELAPRKGQKWF